MQRLLLIVMLALAVRLVGDPAATLPPVVIYSPRVANQEPVGSFAMPVSALQFEPEVDVQARNLAEAQADVTIRGGTFMNTGLKIGGIDVMNPQTGHYLMETPVPPIMLGPPDILTGPAGALAGTNANVGTIAYAWRPVQNQGRLMVGGGEYGLWQYDLYQGGTVLVGAHGAMLGADADFAQSASAGSLPHGDHDFRRASGRVQLHSTAGETNLFAGYQAKFFGWPDLYTPYGVDESENLQNLLFVLDQRKEWAGGSTLEAGIYHQRNKDDYEFDRFQPGLYNPYQHTTWVTGGAVGGQVAGDDGKLSYRAEVTGDHLDSTSLIYGRYLSRLTTKLALAGERDWALGDGGRWRLLAGVTYDDTNRDSGALAPVAELTREFAPGGGWRSLSLGYVETTQMPDYTALNSAPGAGLFRGNPNLGRAYTRDVELRLRGEWAGWTVRAALFARRDRDLVDWTYTTNVNARTANPVDVDTAGFEAVARRVFEWGDVTLGYTWLGKDADYRAANVDASFYALNYARHRLTAAVQMKLGRRWQLRMDNEARLQEPNALRTSGGDDALLSTLALVWRPPALDRCELSLTVANLWNSTFETVPAVPAARRQTALSLAYAW